MKRRFFNKWNWEYDYGEEELPSEPGPDSPHAVAHYDGEGRLYRVVITRMAALGKPDTAQLTYDYFCDDTGRVLEKRSLDEFGMVVLLVRFIYESSGEAPTQVAFNPKSGDTRSAVRKDYLTKRMQNNNRSSRR